MSSSRRLTLAILLLLSISRLAFARQDPAPQSTAPPLLLGTAWYPEQWPESRWDADLTLMQQSHIHVVRVGEFAWSTMEPTEGHYDFAWLDRAITLAARHNIFVVLGTPTAAPPAWLTSEYPQTLRVEEDGHRAEHGNRVQFSATSPLYRKFAADIARRLALRYGHNPDILGWQIDNEIGTPTFDPSAVTQWHHWLAAKYGSIAILNRRWTTAYWSQTYDNFDQVPFHSKGENPALLLDYKHFVTAAWTSYVQNQIDVLRPNIDPRQFLTTNTMHWNSVYDHYILHHNLDLAAWDDYVTDGHLDPMLNAALHDLIRGYKQRNFWVMETQPAFVNWAPINSALPPGVTREMAWQAVGHGADAVLYWQWRSALNGQEQYFGTLLGPGGAPLPIYPEIQQIGADFDRAGPILAGTTPHARVAILQSYDSHWAIDFQRHTNLFDYTSAVLDIYRAAAPIAQAIDIVSPAADLTSYPVVFAPALNVLPAPLAERLLAYVRAGGHLILTARSGMKDADDALNPERQPGPLAQALGAHVGQYYALDPNDPSPTVSGALGSGKLSIWAETLVVTSPETQNLLAYGPQNGWLAGQPAAVSRVVGKGTLTYIGAALDPTLMDAAVAKLLTEAGVHPILPGLPSGVELMQRSAPGKPPVWIIINHTSSAQSIAVPHPMFDILRQSQGQSFELAPHGVAVLTAQETAAH